MDGAENLPVLVFPGQGAQAPGMGRDLAEAVPEVRALCARADEVLGWPLSQLMFGGDAEALRDTAVQQPALVLAGLAALKALEVRRGRPVAISATAGLSLGEYGALVAADALDFEDALALVHRRGTLMKEAVARAPGGMAAVLQLAEAKVRAACEEAARRTGGVVAPCNFNGGGQIVIGGARGALEEAAKLCKAAGARRVVVLPLSGAFHTALMASAAVGLREALARAPFRTARVPVYANATAAPVTEPEEFRRTLEQQVTLPVLWEQTVQALVKRGCTRFIELGPGRTLSNLIRRIAPDAETCNAGTWDEVVAMAGELTARREGSQEAGRG
jgi:[acyl-carrier-protein] S-malonyltransferase